MFGDFGDNVTITYDEIQEKYNGRMWDHVMLSVYEAESIVGRTLLEDERTKLYSFIGFKADELDRHNSISFDEDGNVWTWGGRGFVDKKLILDIIWKLFNHYMHYDERFEKFSGMCVKQFHEQCRKLKNQTEKHEEVGSEKRGYIYVVKFLDYYKIGKTKDCKRFKEYTKLPEEPDCIILEDVNDADTVEKELHEMFDHLRVRGEWFTLSDMDLQTIRNYILPM